jgi:hypothetical protein
MFITDSPYTAFTTFSWSFFLTWILALIAKDGAFWILILGFGALFIHKALPKYDFGGANVFGRWIGGITGKTDNGASHDEFLFTIVLQFGGALVGGILYNWIFDLAPAPTLANPLYNDGKNFVLFAFANFFQAYAVNRLNCSDNSLDNSFRVVMAYMLSWYLCQIVFAGSIGGITIDFGRQLAGEMIHKDMVDMSKWWILVLAPLAGWGICFIYQWLECALEAKESGDGGAKEEAEPSAPAAANNAEQV